MDSGVGLTKTPIRGIMKPYDNAIYIVRGRTGEEPPDEDDDYETLITW